MTEADKQKLYRVIRDYMNRNHGPYMQHGMARRIQQAHNGMPDGSLVTTDNMWLFRQYRNAVSPSPSHMVAAALADRKEGDE